jgi:hypothetical protein
MTDAGDRERYAFGHCDSGMEALTFAMQRYWVDDALSYSKYRFELESDSLYRGEVDPRTLVFVLKTTNQAGLKMFFEMRSDSDGQGTNFTLASVGGSRGILRQHLSVLSEAYQSLEMALGFLGVYTLKQKF